MFRTTLLSFSIAFSVLAISANFAKAQTADNSEAIVPGICPSFEENQIAQIFGLKLMDGGKIEGKVRAERFAYVKANSKFDTGTKLIKFVINGGEKDQVKVNVGNYTSPCNQEYKRFAEDGETFSTKDYQDFHVSFAKRNAKRFNELAVDRRDSFFGCLRTNGIRARWIASLEETPVERLERFLGARLRGSKLEFPELESLRFQVMKIPYANAKNSDGCLRVKLPDLLRRQENLQRISISDFDSFVGSARDLYNQNWNIQ